MTVQPVLRISASGLGGTRRLRRPEHYSAVRTDIQALRALAVAAVVVYHLWPERVPGGFVGVDVFFVISGFLITGQLVRRIENNGRIQLASFWASRARRLLPLSFLVLVISIALTVWLAPETLKQQYLRSISGSALYIENWLLAGDAVDYLAKDNAPPIAQHYWSLAVEEQFYLIWPLLMLLASFGINRIGGSLRARIAVLVAFVGLISFGLNLWLTWTGSPFAYFATPGRMWEFALGAAIAIMPAVPLRRGTRLVLLLLGWGALAVSMFAISGGDPFPGIVAVLPTAATALVIVAGKTSTPNILDRVLASRPVQWVGDQSYGIYLWHWPLIVIAPSVLGRERDLLASMGILGATLIAAAATKRLIEDPIRFSRRAWLRHPPKIGIASLIATILVFSASILPSFAIDARADERAAELSRELLDPDACRGASVLIEPQCVGGLEGHEVDASNVVPSLGALYEDTGGAYACYDSEPSADLMTCTFGSNRDDATRIALTGDSHAAMLIPAMRQIAEERNWSVDTYVGRGCVWLVSDESDECSERRNALSERFTAGGYDAILQTALNPTTQPDSVRDEVSAGIAAAWQEAADAGIPVIAVADNPGVPQEAADCLATTAVFDLDTCAFGRSADDRDGDPIRRAAAATGVPLVDLEAAYCDDERCPMVAGGVVVYRDLHHITATFSLTLAPYLGDQLAESLAER